MPQTHDPPSIRIFLSAASAEFGCYREPLRKLLTRPNVEVKVQEDFIQTGQSTLAKWARD